MSYRPDIDGLRALAVLGVVLFHAHIPGFDGGYVGVDIFFVISGFLITSILVRELDKTGRVDFWRFWARRTRRLLPLALFVLVATLLVAVPILSKVELHQALRDALFASVYLINWTKLYSAVDYFDAGDGEGPFLHYWSLAVEEQFYVTLTLVVLAAVYASRRLGARWGAPRLVIVLLLGAGLLSFVANLVSLAEAQPIAFFGTHARVWQLSLGAAVFFVERAGRLPNMQIRFGAAWGGLVAMVVAIIIYGSETSYPGFAAILPTLGAAAFIYAGVGATGAPTTFPARVAATSIPVGIGRISYALYLWHWPVFTLWQAYFQRWETLDIVGALTLTLILSVLSHVTLEQPVRHARILAQRNVGSLAGAIALTVAFLIAVNASKNYVGEGTLIVLADGTALNGEAVRRDRPKHYFSEPPCHATQKSVEPLPCIFGDVQSERSIVLFGDSHAAQWFPALEPFALQAGYALYVRTKSACQAIDGRFWNTNFKREYTECTIWRNRVIDEIIALKPSLVVIANSAAAQILGPTDAPLKGADRLKALAAAEKRVLDKLRAAKLPIALIRETPWLAFDPISCLVENGPSSEVCKTPTEKALARVSPWTVTASSNLPGTALVDMQENYCAEGFCLAATDNHVVMRDRHHLTPEFAASLAPALAKQLTTFLQNQHR